MPARDGDTVEVPKAWLVLLAGGLIVALLVVAYLVGRESGRRAAEPTRAAPAAAAALGDEGDDRAFDDEAPAAPVQLPEQYPTPDPAAPWTQEDDPPEADPQPPAWIGTEAGRHPQSAAVATYFTEIESFERQAKYWSNPQELAMTLMGQGVQGDTSGFRQLLETQRAAQRQIESMLVPAPCQEHHRRTVEVMRESLALLEQLEDGVASGNLEGLLGLSGEARRLEAETREVDALAAELKRQHGV